MMMVTDEFVPGQSIMRLIGGAYEYRSDAGSRIMLPNGGLRLRDEMLRNLATDVCRRLDFCKTAESITSPGAIRLLCRTALQREKGGAIVFAGIDKNCTADIKMLFSGRMPSKSRLLAAAKELFGCRRYTCGAVAHSFTDTDGLTDAVYANELYQLAAESGINLGDYLVFRGIDCYSVRDQYREFWK